MWAERVEVVASTFAVTGDITARALRIADLAGVPAQFDRTGNALFIKGTASTVVVLGGDDPTLAVTGEGPDGDGAVLLGGRPDSLGAARAIDREGRSHLVRVEGEGDQALVRVPGGPPPGTMLRVGPVPEIQAGRLRGRGAGLIGLLVAAAASLARAQIGALLLLAHARLSPRGLEGALPTGAEAVVLPVLRPGGEAAVGIGGTVPAPTWDPLPEAPRFFVPPGEVPAVHHVRAAGARYLLVGLPAAGIGEGWESLSLEDLAPLARLIGEVVAGRR